MSGVETRFGADTTPFTRGVESMRAQVRGLGNTLQSSVGGGVRGMMAGLAAGFSISAIKDVFNEYDRIAKLAGQLGESGEDVQRLAHAVDLSGASIETLSKQFITATQKVREFRAGLKSVDEDGGDSGKKIGRAMQTLGISSADFVSADLSEQVMMVAKGMEELENPTLANAAALDLLGTRAKDLLPLLQSGQEGIRKMMEETKVLSDDDLLRIQAFNDALTTLGQGAKAAAAGLGMKVLGVAQGASAAMLKGAAILRSATEFFGMESESGSAAITNAAANALRDQARSNLGFRKPDAESKSGKGTGDDARFEVERKLAGLRSEAEEKIAAMQRDAAKEKLSLEWQWQMQREAADAAWRSNDFDAAVKAKGEMIKLEKEMGKAAEKLAAKEADEIKKAAEEKADAMQSLADLEKDTARERLSVEEQIAELRKEAIEQAAAGNFKAAADAGKELTSLIGKQIDDSKRGQEALQGSAGVIADSLRKSGLGGVAVSASINKSILQVNQDALGELRAIRAKIGETDSDPKFK